MSAFLQTSFHGARRRYLIGRVFLYVSAALIVAWSAAPFLWQFSTSFQLDRDLVRHRIPPFVYASSEKFSECPTCAHLYWSGTHPGRIMLEVQRIGIA